MGRSDAANAIIKQCLLLCQEFGKYVVIDADGITLIASSLNLINGNTNGNNCIFDAVVLTPNVNEFKRLQEVTNCTTCNEISAFLRGVTIIKKGCFDYIALGSELGISCKTVGSPRRCGGQGDILAGVLGSFLAWADCARKLNNRNIEFAEQDIKLACCYAACVTARCASGLTYNEKGRSMIASDILVNIHIAFNQSTGEIN